MSIAVIIAALWIGFIVCWIALAAWSSKAEKRAGLGSELPYRIVLILGAIVFFIPAHGYRGPLRLWLVTRAEAWICVALVALGFAFSAWARVYLGQLWSGSITKKPDHRIVDTGPYGIVRHPIYTGILLAVFATAAAKGTVLGLIGAFLITIGIWMKARLEERWLRQELGAEAYDAYCRKVSMLIPFGPKAA
ncbi:MAG TPA: isoprenylcysteine carboxylmethyltransferase family protein [Rhizomicrobium sp.]|jgi:protein-S-isoprenylcysteine O-methyltransferase Ste14|nr:isoprenylcysteine carboxylmethyltransferase family protein [Rhizomicrobium sp.]